MDATDTTLLPPAEPPPIPPAAPKESALIATTGNQIKTAVSWLEPEQREAVVWLYEHGRDGGLTLASLAGKLGRGAQHGP